MTGQGTYVPAQVETCAVGAVTPRVFRCFRRKSSSHKQNEAVEEDIQLPLP